MATRAGVHDVYMGEKLVYNFMENLVVIPCVHRAHGRWVPQRQAIQSASLDRLPFGTVELVADGPVAPTAHRQSRPRRKRLTRILGRVRWKTMSVLIWRLSIFVEVLAVGCVQ